MTHAHPSPLLNRPESWLAAGMTVVLALQLLLGYRLDLYSDEIFYWQAATRPALAYSDLPFMTALLAGLGTQLGIDHALAVRLPFILLGTLLPLLVVWLARPMVGRQQAVEAGLLSLCIPLAGFAGLLAVPDVPLLCFGIVAIGSFDRGMRTGHLRWWLAAGAAAALGFSTHYRFLPYGAAALAFLSLFPAGRAQWRRPGLWLAATIAATGMLPILWFNLNHDLSGLGYHLLERHPWEFQWIGFLHVFTQALLVTPPLYVMLLITLWRMWQRARQDCRNSQLLLCFALANLLPFLLLAPWTDSTRTTIHWTLSGYLPALVFLPESLRRLQTRLQTRLTPSRTRKFVLAIPLLGFAGTLVAFIGVGSQAWHDRLQPWLGDNVLSNKMAGWQPFSAHTAALLELQFPNTNALVVTDNYYTAAQVEFGIDEDVTTYTIDNDKALRDGRISQYAIWQRDARSLTRETGRDALFISEDSTLTVPEKQAVLANICRRVTRVEVVDQLSLLHGEKRFTYYRLSGILPDPLPPVSAMTGCPHPPQAWIDGPQSDAEVAGVLLIEGWVFNEGVGLREVRVVIDDQIVGTADYGLPRPDVAEVMGVFTDPNSPNLGFSLALDTGNLPPGEHSLALELVSNSGEIQRFGERRIKIRKD